MQPEPKPELEAARPAMRGGAGSGRFVGVRGPGAAQRARALHLAVAADETTSMPLDDFTSDEPLPEPATARSTPAADVTAPQSAAGGSPAKSRRKRILMGAVALVVLAAGAWFGTRYMTVGRYMVSTDDAYVRADATTLAAKVGGYVASVDVADNSFVHSGDVIAHIDDGDYRLALDAARGKVETQRATVARIGEQIPAAQAQVEQARAQLVSAQAAATRTDSELARQVTLAQRDFASRQTLEAANANVAVLRAQQQEAERTLNELQTAQAKAERDLSFTQVKAPIDGVIGNRAVQVGDYVQTGT